MQQPTFNYVVLDLETTTKSPVGFSASPFWDENRVVLSGFTKSIEEDVVVFAGMPAIAYEVFIEPSMCIVGHNVKFDMHHICKSMNSTPREIFKDKNVWDTSVAHYILSGMRDRMPSLNEAAARYKLGEKEDGVSALIKSGVCPSDIPDEMLRKYLIQDVELTNRVFMHQFSEASSRNMLAIMWTIMRSVCTTMEMEHNGIKIDKAALDDHILHMEREVENKFSLLCFMFPSINPDSHQQVSIVLFGGTKEYEERELVGKYKNGKDKYKNVKKQRKYDRLVDPKIVGATPTASGHFTCDDSVLNKIKVLFHKSMAADYAGLLLDYREVKKILSTYGEGLRKHLYPDMKIHPNINHNVTATGRLSCSSPNLQNQADHEMRRSYVSSFKDGFLVEIDYAQLEIVGLCILSGDLQLASDLKNGRDIHSELYNDMYGRMPTKEERKPFKSLTFGLVYGAGARTLAENGKITTKEAQRFIERFYSRYPGVKLFHESMLSEAEANRKASALKDEHGMPVETYDYTSVSGRVYRFYGSKKPFKPLPGTREYGFSPTELKNYPVQGFATGDIVPLMLGKIANFLWKSQYQDRLLLINTVHDSIMFDMENNEQAFEGLGKIVKMLQETMTHVKNKWPSVNQEVPFNVEVKLGSTWYSKDMEVVHHA